MFFTIIKIVIYELNPVCIDSNPVVATANAAGCIRHRNSWPNVRTEICQIFIGRERLAKLERNGRREQPSQTSLLSSFEVKTRNASACKTEFIV